MSRGGKPDATGRSSGIPVGRERKLLAPPKGEPWVWLIRELICSDAWRLRSINAARLLDFLLADYTGHAGRTNGRLMATYDQLVAWGLSRSAIRSAVEEAVFLGLIRCQRGGRWAGSNQPSLYRLTFYADHEGGPATNEWKGLTEEEIRAWRCERSATKRSAKAWKKQNAGSASRTTVVQLPQLRGRKQTMNE